ncbi:MAG: hypothetical protein V2A54_18230 [Bacteroidota bacterium]
MKKCTILVLGLLFMTIHFGCRKEKIRNKYTGSWKITATEYSHWIYGPYDTVINHEYNAEMKDGSGSMELDLWVTPTEKWDVQLSKNGNLFSVKAIQPLSQDDHSFKLYNSYGDGGHYGDQTINGEKQ